MTLVLFVSTASWAQKVAKDRILDRKTFKVTLQVVDAKKKQESVIEEEFSFRSNKLSTLKLKSSDMGGFMAGDYQIYETVEMMDERLYRFEAINKNAKDMSLKFVGSVFGDKIEGTATVSKNGKVKEQYTFTGTLKKK
jgi:hypothetical protein